MYANRRRARGARGRRLQRQRSEQVERTFAHVCETGGARRTWLTGIEKVHKRYLIAAMAHNLGRLMRELFGMGTPRGLQKGAEFVDALLHAAYFALLAISRRLTALVARPEKFPRDRLCCRSPRVTCPAGRRECRTGSYSTGC